VDLIFSRLFSFTIRSEGDKGALSSSACKSAKSFKSLSLSSDPCESRISLLRESHVGRSVLGEAVVVVVEEVDGAREKERFAGGALTA